jgi:signal transduction histidine kinase
MASDPTDRPPATGLVDGAGVLASADAALAALQQAAGSAVGRPLALPQLAALARSVQSLRVPLSRLVAAADEANDFDLWVTAEPQGDGVALTIERWALRPPAPSRLGLAGRLDSASDEVEAGLNTAPEPLEWAVDGDLRVTSLSPALAARLGALADDAEGQPLTRLFRLVEEVDGQMPLLGALAARADFAGQRAEPRGQGGEWRLSGAARFTEDGRFAGFAGKVESELADEAARDDSVLNDALDTALRSPLDRIIDAADAIVGRSDGPLRSDYANYASDIAAAGRHLLAVIRSMSETAVATPDAVDMPAAAREAAALVKPAAEQRHVSIEVEPPEQRFAVRGESRGIVQILVNILGNAIRHSPDHGTVAVVFERDGAMVAVTVADQGRGIAAADQQRIFERYEQAGARPAGEIGTGLGLAISRRLARSMGGDIVLVSAPGEGARFTLLLPAA